MKRLRRLLTGRYVWVNTVTQEETIDHYDWHVRWALDGVHLWKWGFIRKYGKMPCGCTRNPFTHRILLYRAGCDKHWLKEKT